MLLFIHIKDNLKSLTSRKLFGVYYHSIVKHAPIQFRLFSGRTANTEKEEAMFTAMKRDTNNSSNFHPDNVMKNIIIRAQARNKIEHTSRKSNQSYLYNLYSPIKLQLQNSLVSYHWIKRYPFEFQCLLQRQADFLLEEHLWWTAGDDGVVFKDVTDFPGNSSLSMHHFRSRTIKDERDYLVNCWKECLKAMHQLIPAYKIKVCDSNNNMETVKLTTLEYFRTNIKESRGNQSDDAGQATNNIDENASDSPLKNFTLKSFQAVSETPLRCKAIINKDNTPELTLTQSLNTTDTDDITSPLYFSTPTVFKQLPHDRVITKLDPIIDDLPKLSNDKKYSNSTKMLIYVLEGVSNLTDTYNKCRKAVKANNSKENYAWYQDVISYIEVKLKTTEEILREQVNKLEIESLNDNEMNEPNNNMKILLKKLKYIKILKKDLIL